MELEQVAASPEEPGPSALDDAADPSFPDPLVDLDAIVSGGPPPDGIPPIDSPRFERAGDIDWIEPSEPVLALRIGDEDRAYPVQVLIWHEIVNDTVDGIPVAVTYCPLCNSAVAYDRRNDGKVLSFGTSGKLYNSALVMYDRQTESLWSHFSGEAIVGRAVGTALTVHPLSTVAWGEWKSEHPDAWVLSRDTGHERDYGRNPYPGYDDVDTQPFLFDGPEDPRLSAKERVVGITVGDDAVAVRTESLAASRVRNLELGGLPLVAWHETGTASALDDGSIAGGRDVGTTGVFEAALDGSRLDFTAAADGFVDRQTGSHWNVLGSADSGPLAGRRLTPVAHVDTFWFAWAAFQPDTQIVE